MSNVFYKIKRDKLYFALVLTIFIVFVFDAALIIFDCLCLAEMGVNSAILPKSFVPFNIVVLVFNVLGISFAVTYYILKRVKRILGKSK